MPERVVRTTLILVVALCRAQGRAAQDQAVAANLPQGLAASLDVQWIDVTASSVLADLARRLGLPIWTTEEAGQDASKCPIHLVARGLNGFQALNALCRLAQLQWTLTDNVICITRASATPSTWRLGGLAWRKRILKQHPEWIRGNIAKTIAALDLAEVSPGVAVDRVAEAYTMNVCLARELRSSQKLISLQGAAVPVAEAMAELARQLGVDAKEEDGIFWMVAPDAITTRSVVPSPQRHATQGGRGDWTVLRSGSVSAEGWAEDVSAVRRLLEGQTHSATQPKQGPAHDSER